MEYTVAKNFNQAESVGRRNDMNLVMDCDTVGDGINSNGTWPWRRSKQMNSFVSHRHIEKRRRDRINRTLVQLKDLVPMAKQKFKDRAGARLEKAELLEMTIEYLQELQCEQKRKPAPIQDSPSMADTKLKDMLPGDYRYMDGFKDGVSHVLKNIRDLGILPVKSEADFCCRESTCLKLRAVSHCQFDNPECRPCSTLHDLAEAAVQRSNDSSREVGATTAAISTVPFSGLKNESTNSSVTTTSTSYCPALPLVAMVAPITAADQTQGFDRTRKCSKALNNLSKSAEPNSLNHCYKIHPPNTGNSSRQCESHVSAVKGKFTMDETPHVMPVELIKSIKSPTFVPLVHNVPSTVLLVPTGSCKGTAG